jgi:alpha-glucosidase
MMATQNTAWWQHGIVYEIYPRSFQDSNGDGIGDLEGIRCRLDYLAWLGVDAIWIAPIYPSPMADGGYDVSDYRGIDPIFGTAADFERLLTEAHARGLKVILDFVPNHTSDQHRWFLESRSSRDNVRREWYIWRDPAPDGGPPNNWLANFGGSGWEYDAVTGQYWSQAACRRDVKRSIRRRGRIRSGDLEIPIEPVHAEGRLDIHTGCFPRGLDEKQQRTA